MEVVYTGMECICVLWLTLTSFSAIRLTPPSLLVPRSHDILIASVHTSYQQQPSEGTKDATGKPNG